MRKEKKGDARSFRPEPENRDRLEYAEKIGISATRLVNDLLKQYGRNYLEAQKKIREKEFRQAIEAPVP